jgi:hypothetical protein
MNVLLAAALTAVLDDLAKYAVQGATDIVEKLASNAKSAIRGTEGTPHPDAVAAQVAGLAAARAVAAQEAHRRLNRKK